MQHRKFKPEFKLQCVLDILSGRKSPAQICREHNMSESVLNKWRHHSSVGRRNDSLWKEHP